MDSTEALRCCSNAAEADRGGFCGGHENRESREVDGQSVPHQGGVGKGHVVEINTKIKVERRRKGLGESSDDELVLLSADSDSDSEGIAIIGEDVSSHTKDPDRPQKYQGASIKVGDVEHREQVEDPQEKQNATTGDNGYSPTAETMAKLPGVETAEDRQRILGPLSNLVFPFFDVIFPRALLDRTLEKNKVKYNSRHVQAFGERKEEGRPQDVYTVDHLYGLLGIVVLMGCIELKRLDLYWSNRPQYYFPELRNCMPRNIFWRLFTRFFRQIGTSDRIKAGQRGYRSNHHARRRGIMIEECEPPPRLTHMKFTGLEAIASQKIRSYVTDRKLYQAMVNAHHLFVSWCKIRLVQADEQLEQLKKDEPTRETAEKLRSLEKVSYKLDKLSRKDRLGWDMALSSAMMEKCGGHVKRARGGRVGENPPPAVPSGSGVWFPTAYKGKAPCFNQERLTAVDSICIFPQENCQCKRCIPYSTRFCVKSTHGGCCCKKCTTKEGKTRTRICEQCCANPESHMRAYNFAWLKTLKGCHRKRQEVVVPDRLLREGILDYKRKTEQQSQGKRSKAKSDT